MPLLEIRWNPSPRELRLFAVLTAAFVGGAAVMLLRRSGASVPVVVLLAAAVLVATVGLAVPRWVRPLYVAWMAAAFPVGWLVSHVLLAVVYYGVMTPIGLTRRLMGRDPLGWRFDPAATTYWVSREPVTDHRRYFRQF